MFAFGLLMNRNKCYGKLDFLSIGENRLIIKKIDPLSVFFFFFFHFMGGREDGTSPFPRWENFFDNS